MCVCVGWSQFHAGYAGTLLYDGENFVNNTNVVMAVIQCTYTAAATATTTRRPLHHCVPDASLCWCCTDRLGALGFLYTGDDISGNYGLLDQKYATKPLHTHTHSLPQCHPINHTHLFSGSWCPDLPLSG